MSAEKGLKDKIAIIGGEWFTLIVDIDKGKKEGYDIHTEIEIEEEIQYIKSKPVYSTPVASATRMYGLDGCKVNDILICDKDSNPLKYYKYKLKLEQKLEKIIKELNSDIDFLSDDTIASMYRDKVAISKRIKQFDELLKGV